jgi:hypothetical protein
MEPDAPLIATITRFFMPLSFRRRLWKSSFVRISEQVWLLHSLQSLFCALSPDAVF